MKTVPYELRCLADLLDKDWESNLHKVIKSLLRLANDLVRKSPKIKEVKIILKK